MVFLSSVGDWFRGPQRFANGLFFLHNDAHCPVFLSSDTRRMYWYCSLFVELTFSQSAMEMRRERDIWAKGSDLRDTVVGHEWLVFHHLSGILKWKDGGPVARLRVHVHQPIQLYTATYNKTSRSFTSGSGGLQFCEETNWNVRKHEMCVLNVSEMQWTKLTPSSLLVNQTAVWQLCAPVWEDMCQETERGFVFLMACATECER